MFRLLGWRDLHGHRPQRRTDRFENSPTPPTNVDEELSGIRSEAVTADLKASERGRQALHPSGFIV
jgi:hypothetical protein